MKVVIDTNVLISGIFWQGIPRQILNLWLEGKIEIVITQEIFQEYLKIIQEIDSNKKILQNWTLLISEKSTIISDTVIVKLCRDPKDDQFINCALLGKVDYLISGDKDLLELKTNLIEIVNPKAFLTLYAKNS